MAEPLPAWLSRFLYQREMPWAELAGLVTVVEFNSVVAEQRAPNARVKGSYQEISQQHQMPGPTGLSH